MDIHFLQQIAQNNIILWEFIIFFWILITNIVPIMFFLYPDVFIFIAVFIVKQNLLVWYVPFIILIFWAWIGEIISYYIWRKYWVKILDYKIFQKDISKKWVEKLKKNSVKTFIIWKVLPAVGWFIPVLSWIIKMDPRKFVILDLIMITIAISGVYFTWIIWAHFLQKWFWIKIWFILWAIFIIYIIGHLIYEFKIKKK